MSRLWTSVGAHALATIPATRAIAVPRECGATSNGNSADQGTSGARPSGAAQWCALALATSGGVGYAPVAPGTFGAAVGACLYVLLAGRGAGALLLALVALTAAGIWAAGEAERIFARADDGRIVIDEVAGQLLALLPLVALSVPERGVAPLPLLVGFAAFRVLDIAKPAPVRWAERRFPGGVGVMADDLVAGALAAIGLAALAALGAFGRSGA